MRRIRETLHSSPQNSFSGKRPESLFLLLGAVSIAAILVAVVTEIHEVSILKRSIWLLCGGFALLAIVYFKARMRLDWLSPPVVYAIIFWGFHFGLVFPAAISPAILEALPRWARDWLDTPETQKAVFLSLLFLICFLLGFFLIGKNNPLSRDQAISKKKIYARELVLGGWISIGLGLIIVVLSIIQLGIGSFLEPYEVFFEINDLFSVSIGIISFGLILQAAGGRPYQRVLISAAFFYLPIAIPTLLAGARTAPLFSAATLAVVLAKRGFRVPRLGLIVMALFLLGLIALIQETRQVGLSQSFRSIEFEETVSPLSGLAELGGSLRPVYAVINYVDVLRQNYSLGYTYIYPFYRQLQKLLGLERGGEFTDPGFVAMHINLQYGSIGFSTVAEAFLNGGVPGVMVFALLWGSVLGYLNRRADTPYGLALLAVILIPMMINIRNSFIYVPAWIFIGLVVLGFCRYFLAIRKLRH